jgi:protein-S-isoprenylcysteine O-methyltransferase Ste14
MGLDIRYPIGIMFTLIGGLLVVFGLATYGNTEVYRRSLGININLWWGLVLLAFGLFMLLMAWRAARKAPQASTESEPAKSASSSAQAGSGS